MKTRIGIAGYGNLGRGVEFAVAQNPDTELVAVFTRRNPETVKIQTEGVKVYPIAEAASHKDEIDVLRDAKPEKDYTVDNITTWLESLRQAPDEKAIRLLISKISVKNRTDVSIDSMLTSILGNLGCGTRIRT